MNQTRRRGAGSDGGFTLVELIIAIVILGIITVPLSNVVIAYLRNTDATTARLIESHDVQIASAYWAQDVASIGMRIGPGDPEFEATPYALTQSVETGVAFDSGLFPCGTAGTVIVRLAWDDFSGADATPQVLVPTQVRVAYVVQTVSGETTLHRFRCNGSPVVVSDVTLAHDLDPSTPPMVACPTTTAECTPGPPTTVPKTVQLTLTLKDPKNRDAAYDVTLTGQRRQSS